MAATTPPRDLECIRSLANLVAYDRETGQMTWLPRERSAFRTNAAYLAWNTKYAGRTAGATSPRGYIRVRHFGTSVQAHRLAFFMVHGFLPVQVDHENRKPSDNRAANLRAATPAQNCANRGKIRTNVSGIRGVRFNKERRKWVAYVQFQKKQRFAGYFDDIELAKSARDALARKLHGHFASIEEIQKHA